MKLAVIGAGIVGITSAYELTLDGHEVTVFERRQTAAEEASFACGGLIAAGWSVPLHSPDRGLRQLLPGPHSAAALRLVGLPRASQWQWLRQCLRASTSGAHRAAAAQLHLLTRYSQQRLDALSSSLQLTHDRAQGLLVLWRSEANQAQAHSALAWLREQDWPHQMLSRAQAHQVEPALNAHTPLHAALWLPEATAVNCRQFALLLKAQAQQRGCRFEFAHTVERLSTAGGVTLTHCQAGQDARHESRFDAVVVCAGATSAALLRPLGLHLPLQAVYGHSISAALREPLDAPAAAVLDAHQQVSITRLGQRIRVAGGLQFGGAPARESAAELRRLHQVLSDWFPGAARFGGGGVQEWQGAQAFLPDAGLLLGQSRLPAVWFNLGHGGSGWALACGCARALADQMQGRVTDLDLAGFAPQRLGL
ncbi:FAD-dependent oxidoreductase [Hydrogenophaga sp.]|uniref:FAD-dependent oxidoreductase n=1 Tax=Hydrogenophaga sp. TaxID=1904254 RepID=UPI0019C17546|nr:FAD-dependent oxidoreductase [Hydrogenophaga sp.]MBD3892741.1 FAD-dependent oxidoreductase [Hydrogenophaga sp.]